MKKFKFFLSIICLCLFLSTLMFFANSVDATVEEDLQSKTKITSTTNTVQAPTITVLTHGFGANYTHWSNDGSSNDFAYNSNSIIVKMFTELENNLNIYIADSNSTINTDGTLTLSFDLIKMTYNDYVNNIDTKTTAMIGEIIGCNASSGTFSSITSNISSNINCAIITQQYCCFACEDGKIGYRE